MQSQKIMIVDDSTSMRTAIKKILMSYGYTSFIEAENGTDAIAKYEEFKPDLTILDIVMPEMDGVETLTKIRQIDNRACVIMSSAASDANKIALCMKKGALGFIEKPYGPKELISTIEKLLKPHTEHDKVFTLYSYIASKIEESLRKITNDSLLVTFKKVDYELEKKINLPVYSIGVVTKVVGERSGILVTILNRKFLVNIIKAQHISLNPKEELDYVIELFNILNHNYVNEYVNFIGQKISLEPPRLLDKEKPLIVNTKEFIKIEHEIYWKDSQTILEFYQCLN